MVYVTGVLIDGEAPAKAETYFCAPEYFSAFRGKSGNAAAESFFALACLARLLSDRGIPAGVRLARDAAGRPYLPDHPALDFSVSHTGKAAFCALSDGGRVGIDAEELRPFPRAERVAARFFSEGERGEFNVPRDPESLQGRDLPAESLVGQAERFFRIWTRKEAYLKYLGTGFSEGGLAIDTTGLDQRLFHRLPELSLGCVVTVCTEPENTVCFL